MQKKQKNLVQQWQFFFQKKSPVESSQKVDDEYFARKTKKAFTAIEVQIAEFKKDNKLTIYKKGQLGNALKWKLKEAGYTPEYVNELTMWLIKQL